MVRREFRRPVVLGALIAVATLLTGCTAGAPDDAVVTTVRTTVVAPSGGSPSIGQTPTSTGRSAASTASALPSTSAAPSTHPSSSSVPTGLTSGSTTSAPASSKPVGKPGPTTTLSVTAADVAAAGKIVAGMTLADRAASVIMVSSADIVGSNILADDHFGGVILMGSLGVPDGTTTGTPAQVLALTSHWRQQAAADPAGVAPLIGTDQEYGDVVRLVHGFTEFPGQSVLGSIPDLATATALTGKIAAAAAQELLAVGISVDFAPVSDVLPVDGASGIGDRSYGSDPQRAAALVAAAVTGYQDAGVVSTLKHFPGLGRVPQDTHETLPTLSVSCSSWNSHEAVPLRAGIKAGVAMVMTGHVQLPAAGVDGIPASLSETVVTDLLRGSGKDGCTGLGFGGVTVSDSLQMVPVADSYSSAQAAVLALQAGEDLLLMPVRPVDAAAGIVAAVKGGTLSQARLDDAATRVLALRIAAARIRRPPLSVIDSPAHQKLAAQAAEAAGQ